MRILKFFLVMIIALVIIFFAGGFLIPEDWFVTRSITINASPQQIYPYVASFKEWEKWSPWNASKDATLKYTYEGPSTGSGSKQSWTSEKMGKGWMELTSANPEKGVSYDLFIDMGSSQSNLHGSINFVSNQNKQSDATLVTWTDKGNSGKSYVHRWMSLLLKPMLGKDMNIGLTGLKGLVEKT